MSKQTQPAHAAISVSNLNKTYENGFKALDNVSLEVKSGEIFALLGPNGAGKTTLISTICGIVRPSDGEIKVNGFDNAKDYRKARQCVGLVPQELTTDAFETVWRAIRFSRGLFGKKPNDAYLEQLLKDLSLWDKRDTQIRRLSGGMKRRVLIAKALSHEPEVLFLDEPTAGVDVELRKSMWLLVGKLRKRGVTIVLTTHYIEEAEEMADRIGIISHGKVILTEDKTKLMKKLGKKELVLELQSPIKKLPTGMAKLDLKLEDDGNRIVYTYESSKEENGVASLLDSLREEGIRCKDFNTRESSLEDIFVTLVKEK